MFEEENDNENDPRINGKVEVDEIQNGTNNQELHEQQDKSEQCDMDCEKCETLKLKLIKSQKKCSRLHHEIRLLVRLHCKL